MNYRVSVYQDSQGQVLIIPNAKDEHGISVEINRPLILDRPYQASEIGECIRAGLQICTSEPFQHSKDFVKVHEIITGSKSYRKFSKKRSALLIIMNTENEYTLLPLQRYPDGSYRPNAEKYPQMKLSADSSNEQIGEAVIAQLGSLR